ncbi:MAG TPA: serine/threonine-protein kinase, partial [Longimicrobiales bacterium]|nr:serine/threonine-protein kinase [Longimicrobiales bacterium]
MTDLPTAAEAHALLERVIDLDPGARAAALDEACARRPELRSRVEELLRFADEESTLLDNDPAMVWAALIDDDDERAVTSVGPWRIQRELGRGGMGAVYLAERADGQFEKQVALKLVKRGMDTDEILARFRLERRILAGLEHPHIARLYDGGASEDGRPYLVMELVDGEPITTWCDRHCLGIDERLALFCTICAAVQFAHQKLVVHRDLKPSNIMVAKDGAPKLLDFGIARLLTEDETSSMTRTGVRVLTPEYAAPEQLRGEAVSTAADVYALGAVLFELLTGSGPFGGDRRTMDPDRIAPRPSLLVGPASPDDPVSTAHAAAAARSTTPAKLRRRLEGDLDIITLRALDPDPARRYGSAQQLLDDLERHRAGLPVQARAPTLVYRARKFARRNRAPIVAAALVTIALAGGLASTLWQARTAARERDTADAARRSAEEVMAFLLGMFDSADPLGVRTERTDTMRVRQLVDRGAERVRTELANQPRLQAEMLTMLGRVYSNLGVFESAEEMLEEAVLAAGAANAATESRAIPLILLGVAANQQGSFARADSLLAAAIAVYDETGAAHDSTYMNAVTERGVALMHNGAYERSAAMHAHALALVDSLGL